MANKDMKSTANMTLQDLARELPRLQAEAKALWGDAGEGQLGQMPSWKYYLANMVIADDPIKYLGQNL